MFVTEWNDIAIEVEAEFDAGDSDTGWKPSYGIVCATDAATGLDIFDGLDEVEAEGLTDYLLREAETDHGSVTEEAEISRYESRYY